MLPVYLLSGCSSRAPIDPDPKIPTVKPVTPQEEQYGHQMVSRLSEQYSLDYEDSRLDLLQDIVEHLAEAAGANDDPWHVYLFNEPDRVYLRSVTGNHILVWSGLLDFVASDDELAVLLAHEMAHLLTGHDGDSGIEVLVQNLALEVSSMAIAVGLMYVSSAASISIHPHAVKHMLIRGLELDSGQANHSEEAEQEADMVALLILAKSRFDPDAALCLWERVAKTPEFADRMEDISQDVPVEERLSWLREMLPGTLSIQPTAVAKFDTFDMSYEQ